MALRSGFGPLLEVCNNMNLRALTFGVMIAFAAATAFAMPAAAKPSVIDDLTIKYDDGDTVVSDPDSCNDNDNSFACSTYCDGSGYANKPCSQENCTGDESCRGGDACGNALVPINVGDNNCSGGPGGGNNNNNTNEQPTSAPYIPLPTVPSWLKPYVEAVTDSNPVPALP